MSSETLLPAELVMESSVPLASELPSRWTRFVSHLFFLLFTSPVLSPAVNERALYLYWIVPLLDQKFIAYLIRSIPRTSFQAIAGVGLLVTWLAIMAPAQALRWILIIWPLAYLMYSFETKIFYLYFWIGFNVLVACAQASAFFLMGPGAAMRIGPGNIGFVLWGPYAARSYTNFYSIIPGFDLPRFAGLSREGGFFAALIGPTVLLKVIDRKNVGWVLFIGVMLSISKSTAFLALGWLLTLIAMKDRRTPAILFLPFLLTISLLYYFLIDPQLMTGQLAPTFTHRLFSYSAMFHDMDVANFIVGNKVSPTTIVQFSSFQVCRDLVGFADCLEMGGFPAIIFWAGLIGLCLYLWQLSALGVGVWGMLLIFILTSNVSPLTSSSFVVLSYFVALRVTPASRTGRSGTVPAVT